MSEEQVWRCLRQVNDPEFPLNIVDLGMVYGVSVARGRVEVTMTFTSIGCPAIEMIISDMYEAVSQAPGVADIRIEVVWSPAWTRERISPQGRNILATFGVAV